MSNTQVKRKTRSIQAYAKGQGAYQTQAMLLRDQMVPQVGKSSTVQGELLRIALALYHERMNNNNSNTIDQIETEELDWAGDAVEETVIVPKFRQMLDFLNNNMPEVDIELVYPLEKQMINSYHASYTTDDYMLYERLIDTVVHFILNNKNLPL